jgi:hypothetical protein
MTVTAGQSGLQNAICICSAASFDSRDFRWRMAVSNKKNIMQIKIRMIDVTKTRGLLRPVAILCGYSPAFDTVELSVPKAQMVFWTGIILVLFIVKSLLIGGLWEVPWGMVALTGISQAGYVGDKATKRYPAPESKPANSKAETPGQGQNKPARNEAAKGSDSGSGK